MRIISKSRGHFYGTHKGCEIEITKQDDGTYYILVTGKDGCHRYNGWAPDSVRTMPQAKREAIRGACLDEPKV